MISTQRNIADVDELRIVLLKQIPEPVICKYFGCGRHLTPQEQLYGMRCQAHSKHKKQDITKVIKFK